MANAIGVISADWHLDGAGRGAWRRKPGLVEDSFRALVQVVDLCLARDLPLLAAGDLLDTTCQDDASSIRFANEQIARMAERRLPVYYIQGQHEGNRVAPWLSLCPWARHVDGLRFNLGGIRGFGLDYKRSGDIPEVLRAVPPDVILLMMHQAWVDWMGENRSNGCSFVDTPSNIRILVTGDFHQHICTDVQRSDGSPLRVLSPGALCMRAINEPEHHHVFILHDDLSVQGFMLKSRGVHRLRIETPDDLEKVVAFVVGSPEEPAITRPILHVVCVDGVRDTFQRLEAVTEGKFHLFYQSARDPMAEEAKPAAKAEVKRGLAGNLDRVLPPDSDEFHLAARLLDHPDRVVKELEAAQAEFTARISQGVSAA